MSESIYKHPSEYVQNPKRRQKIVRIVNFLHKSGIFTSDINIQGTDNIRKLQTSAIIGPNHRHMADIFLDGLLLEDYTDRQIYFAAKSTMWKKEWFGRFIESCGAFPVNRSGGGLQHFRETGKYLLEHGSHIVVYPEGKRLAADKIVPKIGAAAMATEVNVPIIPIGQYGTEHMYNPLIRKPVAMVIGEPLYPDEQLAVQTINNGKSQKRANFEVVKDLTDRLGTAMQTAFDQAKETYHGAA